MITVIYLVLPQEQNKVVGNAHHVLAFLKQKTNSTSIDTRNTKTQSKQESETIFAHIVTNLIKDENVSITRFVSKNRMVHTNGLSKNGYECLL